MMDEVKPRRASSTRKLTAGTVLRTGYLQKKGRKRRNWKKRWVELDAAGLSYYDTEQKKKKKGVVVLDSQSKVFESDRKAFCFVVESSQRQFFLVANDAVAKSGWIESISQLIQDKQQGL